jgi:hypothetical protein
MNASIVTSRVERVSSSLTVAISTRKAVPASTPFSVRYVPKMPAAAMNAMPSRKPRRGSVHPLWSAARRHAPRASNSRVTHAGT